jgi:hypothetical protein
MADTDAIDQLADQIVEMCFLDDREEGKGPDIEDVLSALQRTVVFCMALTCSNCRRNIARKFKRDIPRMTVEAGQLAAEAAKPPRCH